MHKIAVEKRSSPPDWAVQQRSLIAAMDRAVWPFVEHATRPDGTLIQRSVWTSMDGTDNGYEAFLSLPLFYLIGGAQHMQTLARKEWDAITWQYEDYGTVEREFVAGFDWFHHSESYTYIYYLGMADPHHHIDRRRALRYAAMYIGEDPLADNWDAERKMLRSPLNGSRGPRFVTTQQDWDYHRPILANYLAPYEDMEGLQQGDPFVKADWTNDETFARVLNLINRRMTRGDVPLNLSSASLVTNAYLYTGEEKYKTWVLEYLSKWVGHCRNNGGIAPDNVGPSGQIGEMIDGKWWGGYYGWRWPHGGRNIVESAYVAGSCAALMTGDMSWLDLCRSQLDMLWDLRRREDGVWKIPSRHGDAGWFDYRVPEPELYIHLCYLSQSGEDRARLEEIFPQRQGFADFPSDWGAGKAGICPPRAWHAWMEGFYPDYPQAVIDSTYECMGHSLARLAADDSNPEERHCYHFQNMNPVLPEALVQMTMGTPSALYNGGLLQAHLRYFDPQKRRAGLPDHVAALVRAVSADGAAVTLVNTDPVARQAVVLQAGSFSEHEFSAVQAAGGRIERVDGRWFSVEMGPATQVDLKLDMRRFVHGPSHEGPKWT